jgi:uncharacterized protein YabE (DUF348 family)
MQRIILRILLPLIMLVSGAYLFWQGLLRPATLLVNGIPIPIQVRAMTVGGALREVGVPLHPQDQLSPRPDAWLGWRGAIRLERAGQVTIQEDDQTQPKSLISAEKLPANVLLAAGIRLFPNDQLFWNGLLLDPTQPLPLAPEYLLQYRKAAVFTITGSQSKQIYTSAVTLGQAMWQAGLVLQAVDTTAERMEEPFEPGASINLERAVPLAIQVDGHTLNTQTSAANVGQALAQVGISLQGLDYSQPAEDQPLPPEGVIQVVRVREEVSLQQTSLPFSSEFVADPNLELDLRNVVEPGQPGLQVTRLRIRYENGQEVSRNAESQWTAIQPKSQKLGYGTKIVIRTMDTPSGTIEYYRAVTVYATSYSNCRLGVPGKCDGSTATGATLQRGIVGVTYKWFLLLVHARVYVPSYGTGQIEDVGGGFPGRYWIDLGYNDADWVAWYNYTTLYFLTPVPANVPWILP